MRESRSFRGGAAFLQVMGEKFFQIRPSPEVTFGGEAGLRAEPPVPGAVESTNRENSLAV